VLAKHVEINELSDKIEYFLIDYALHSGFKELPEILNKMVIRKIDRVMDYESEDFGLPEISEDELLAVIKHSNSDSESTLINYYKVWQEKSNQYESDYFDGIKEKNSRKSERMITPYQDCNLNCYKILLALDSLNSVYFDTTKLENHNQYLKDYAKNMFLYQSYDFIKYEKQGDPTTFHLENNDNIIGEIDFEKEPALKDLLRGYSKGFCWKFVMYNGKIGYLDVGCQSGPLAGNGVVYRIELIDNITLRVFELSNWIS
jgi:hypothetical protein